MCRPAVSLVLTLTLNRRYDGDELVSIDDRDTAHEIATSLPPKLRAHAKSLSPAGNAAFPQRSEPSGTVLVLLTRISSTGRYRAERHRGCLFIPIGHTLTTLYSFPRIYSQVEICLGALLCQYSLHEERVVETVSTILVFAGDDRCWIISIMASSTTVAWSSAFR